MIKPRPALFKWRHFEPEIISGLADSISSPRLRDGPSLRRLQIPRRSQFSLHEIAVIRQSKGILINPDY